MVCVTGKELGYIKGERGFGRGFWNMRGALWRLPRLVGVGVQEKIVGVHRGDLV